jgi:hypothetical protein
MSGEGRPLLSSRVPLGLRTTTQKQQYYQVKQHKQVTVGQQKQQQVKAGQHRQHH